MSLRQLLLQVRRRCSPQPPQIPGILFLCRALSILTSGASAVPPRRSPTVQVQLPQSLPCSSSDPLGSVFRIDVVDSDLWPASFSFSPEPARGKECPNAFEQHEDDELHDSDDEIDDMRQRKKLFYKLDRGSMEFEENSVPLRRRRKREKGNAKNPKECKKLEPVKSVSSDVPKLKAKRAVREDDRVELKRERVPTFNQMTNPYHHPFCLDIHVTKGSVRACFVHRVTSRVVSVAHSISKDMKFDLGSKKGKGMKACAAVGALLAKHAIEDDIHNAVYTPRKGDRIEGKIEVVLRAIIDNGVDVKVKLKQRKPIKNSLVLQHDQSLRWFVQPLVAQLLTGMSLMLRKSSNFIGETDRGTQAAEGNVGEMAMAFLFPVLIYHLLHNLSIQPCCAHKRSMVYVCVSVLGGF